VIINGYYISGYWWIFFSWLLVIINGYCISGYWWLFHYKPLVIILLMAIDIYSIGDY
jgi:hypothetical protein